MAQSNHNIENPVMDSLDYPEPSFQGCNNLKLQEFYPKDLHYYCYYSRIYLESEKMDMRKNGDFLVYFRPFSDTTSLTISPNNIL